MIGDVRLQVFCRTRFEGFHRWPTAPEEVAFLRDRHRHEFHVELGVWVDHSDRQCEFILLKRALDKFIRDMQNSAPHALKIETWSCEEWALRIKAAFANVDYVVVSEDGENGARIESGRL